MGPNNTLWLKIGRLAAVAVTVLSHSEQSFEARKHVQNKEREIQERPHHGIQEDSPWLRGPRRSSFLKPIVPNRPSITQSSSFVLQSFRAQKDDHKITSQILGPKTPTEEFAPFIEMNWTRQSASVKVTPGMEDNGSLSEKALCNGPDAERDLEDIEAVDETHNDGEYNRHERMLHPNTYSFATLALSLHHSCTDLFADLSPLLLRSASFDKYKANILEDVGRLYLWGESFDQDQLANILDSSPGLRSLVLELTDTLCTVLIEELLPLVQTSNSDPSLLHQVHVLRDLLQQLHAEQTASSEHGAGDADGYSDSDPEEEQEGFSDPESIAFMIRSSVDCLMQLLPSMERTLEATNNKIHSPV